MRYLGSKTLLLNNIFDLVKEFRGGVFCDPFGGIGTVGSFMKQKGFHVISGDILGFAHCFQYSLIERSGDNEFENLKIGLHLKSVYDIEDFLNEMYTDKGWLIEEYSNKRKFFTDENACRIQGCINCIEGWYNNQLIDTQERKILVSSLINSFDKVANTAGTYYAYLKNFDRRAKKKFSFSIFPAVLGPQSCCYKMGADKLIEKKKSDVLYLDPPYNDRNYSRYYHLPETIAMGAIPKPKGKSGVYQVNNITSDYNKKSKALTAFEKLVKQANTRCIVFHYTDNGLINMEEAKEILNSIGTVVEEQYFTCKGYITSARAEENRHHVIKVYM